MNKINVGDVVLFSTGGGLKTNVGMVLKHKDNENYVLLTTHHSAYKDIQPEWIAGLDELELVREQIIEQYMAQINDLRNKIRKVTSEEKETCRIEKYEKLKKEIKIVAKRLSESIDDIDFENRLKAIADMKKCIFSIELDCASDIRKDNGKIKWGIRDLEQRMNAELNKISDESLSKAFNF